MKARLPALLLAVGAAACAPGQTATAGPVPASSTTTVTATATVDSTRVYPVDSVTVKPEITNRQGLARLLSENYPPALRDAGMGGTVRVSFIVDVAGHTRDVRVTRSSGLPALDRATVTVAEGVRFRPARRGTVIVPVLLELPITWSVPAPGS